jgi:hypothetical protein
MILEAKSELTNIKTRITNWEDALDSTIHRVSALEKHCHLHTPDQAPITVPSQTSQKQQQISNNTTTTVTTSSSSSSKVPPVTTTASVTGSSTTDPATLNAEMGNIKGDVSSLGNKLDFLSETLLNVLGAQQQQPPAPKQ